VYYIIMKRRVCMEQYDHITACTLDCPDACSLAVKEAGGSAISIKGNPAHPITRGFACPKIRKYINRLKSPERITTPLLRTGNTWEEIDWNRALNICARKIQDYRDNPSAILYFHGEGSKGVLKQAGELFFSQLGATLVTGSLCDSAGYGACIRDFGSREQNDIQDLVNACVIINWGKDLLSSSVHTAFFVNEAHKKGARVMIISPGDQHGGSITDEHIQIRPGTDRFLAAALIRLFIERSMVSENVISRTANWDEFRAMILDRPMDELLHVCEVTTDELEEIFKVYANDRPAATLIGAGLQRYSFGGENVRFINSLAFISGNIGCPGGGTYFHLNSLRNLNLDWLQPGITRESRLLRMPMIARDILDAENPPIRMIWVDGANLVNQVPDSHLAARAFEQIDFKVVVDAFMTDTAERADLILPPALLLEQEDVVGSYLHDYVHHVKAVSKPPGLAKSDYWILTELGKRLSPKIILPDSSEYMSMSLISDHVSVSLKELRENKFVRANRPVIAYEGMHFDHPDGKYHLPLELHGEAAPSEAFPMRLLSLIRRDTVHSQMLPSEHSLPPVVWVARDCPFLSSLDLGRDVYLVSELGRLKVRVERAPGLHKGAVVYRRGDWMKCGGGANQLIAGRITDMGSGSAYYDQYVRLENG
jgi:anaerobic selenocysteine-containing dehydrogenase